MKIFQLGLVLGAVLLQAASFDVASVKPSQPDAVGSNVDSDPGRLILQNVTLKRCIQRAYEVPDIVILGGPKWLNESRFDIEGRAGYAAGYADLNAMLQSLLSSRFKLSLHHETKSLSGYALTLAKGGSKLKPSAPGTAGHTNDTPGSIVSTAVSMQRLALKLSVLLGVPVVDQTKLNGLFDFTVKWVPDDMHQQAEASGGPSLFTAFQEQLGLKLEARKVPVDMLVVDHAELPTEN